MMMCTKIDPNLPKSLCQDLLGKLFEQKSLGELCDVQFVQGRNHMWAHSCILASFSPFLMRFFVRFLKGEVEWSVRAPIRIQISTLTKCKGKSRNNCMDCVGKVVDFIYTGKIRLDPSHVEHILNISSNLEIENLIIICQKFRSNSDRPFSDVDDPTRCHVNCNETKSVIIEQNINGENCSSVIKTPVIYNILDDQPAIDPKSFSLINTELNVDKKHNPVEVAQPVKVEKNKNNSSYSLLGLHNKDDEGQDERHNLNVQHGLKDKNSEPLLSEDDVSEELFCRLEDNKFMCKRCNVSFTSDIKLSNHERIFHTRKFSCLMCDFTSFKPVYILKHLMESDHCGKVCSICSFEAPDDASLKKHLEDHKHSLPFPCSACGERYKTRTDWIRHSAVHLIDTPYVCKICDITFKRSAYLHSHILTHHKKPKHLCELCGYATPFKSFLARHRLKHSEKRIICSIENCKFSTTRETNLKQHMKTHDSEKAFKCHLCNVQFTQDKNLRRHIQIMHNPNATMFECPSCNYVNSRIDKVKDHVNNIHSRDLKIFEKLKEKYEEAKSSRVPQIIPKYQRVSTIQKSCVKGVDKMKGTIEQYAISPKDETQSKLSTKDGSHIPPRLIGTVPSELLHNPNDTIVDGDNTRLGNPMNKQTVFLSEATGEITIMRHQEGQSIPVASLTSTNLLTIGNFREGTGSVTLNETTGVLTLNNINSESTGAVFLNESTGELSYINLNNNKENINSIQIEECAQKLTGDLAYNTEISTLLNEETGEISTVQEEGDQVKNFCDDDMFDTFDIDIFNEDSFDGFDEFDSYIFDSFNPSGGAEKETTMKNFLNEFTGELLKDLDGETSISGKQDLSQDVWSPVCSLEPSLNLGGMFSETHLNEVTGEFF